VSSVIAMANFDASIERLQSRSEQAAFEYQFAPLSCVALLQSISPGDAKLLKHTREYRDFVKAAERLQSAHRQISQWNKNRMTEGTDPNASFDMTDFYVSFLQDTTTDDIINRVFDCLECRDLVSAMMTCSRFRELAVQNAAERTKVMTKGRQLTTTMQLLRAQEQIEGIAGIGITDRHVPVPTLLLTRRVLVTASGDPEYNGVYFCTGSNGNGFVFTKPRSPEQRVTVSDQRPHRSLQADVAFFDSSESEVAQPGQLLRCIIAKRFSNEVSFDLLNSRAFAPAYFLFFSLSSLVRLFPCSDDFVVP
jgi:hypothetical protein